jgi:hypothetical protein
VLVAGVGPVYSPIAEMGFGQTRTVLDEHLLGSLRVARKCATRVHRADMGLSLVAIVAAALPAIAVNAALERHGPG